MTGPYITLADARHRERSAFWRGAAIAAFVILCAALAGVGIALGWVDNLLGLA